MHIHAQGDHDRDTMQQPPQTLADHGARPCCHATAHDPANDDAHRPATNAVAGHRHGHGAHAGSPAGLATAATLHCLTGCAIGEFAGLTLGVSLGIGVWPTLLLATALAFLSGYTLGLWPLVRQGMGWLSAFKVIWLGETLSIAVMELAMNFTDYHVGGVQVDTVFAWRFWIGFAAALPAGFLLAWPVNYWLLKRNLKKPCH